MPSHDRTGTIAAEASEQASNRTEGQVITGIDTHGHVFLHSAEMIDGRRYTPAYDATLDDYLDMLDANGVGCAASPWSRRTSASRRCVRSIIRGLSASAST